MMGECVAMMNWAFSSTICFKTEIKVNCRIRGKRSFGFIEEVQTIWDKAGLEQGQEGFAM